MTEIVLLDSRDAVRRAGSSCERRSRRAAFSSGQRTYPEQGWTGDYAQTGVTIRWSAREEGFTFQSEESSAQWGVIGRHRNGRFFKT